MKHNNIKALEIAICLMRYEGSALDLSPQFITDDGWNLWVEDPRGNLIEGWSVETEVEGEAIVDIALSALEAIK
tara:strand:- start:365 stop:586 length:222 start_codon:yes stop_codon:yes gene_type:complete